MDDLFRQYRLNSDSRWLHNAENYCWKLHLKPFFGHVRAVDLNTDLLNRYVNERKSERKNGKQPAHATINRELATLRAALNLGRKASPPKVFQVPPFAMLTEQNVRKGFVRDEQYDVLGRECAREGLWLRALVGVAHTYGWHRGELLELRVRQVDLGARTIDLEPGTTKNDDGRVVVMTREVYELLRACIPHKGPDDYVFTRGDDLKIGDFRKVWQNVCIRSGLGRRICKQCGRETKKAKCEKCKNRTTYLGTILHDFRRTGCRNLRRLGVSEKTIMKIGGWKTRAVFDRYDIVDHEDLVDASRRLDEKRDRKKRPGGQVPKRLSPRYAARVN